MNHSDPDKAFSLALSRGILSLSEDSPKFIGNFMYTGDTDKGEHLFKHKDSRQYLDPVPTETAYHTNRYAVDGKCHNAEPGTYGHECGKPAVWLGTKQTSEGPFSSGFCNTCRFHGYEARPYSDWKPWKAPQ